jgi:hypothetical protein
MASRGFETTIITAQGEYWITCSVTFFTITALVSIRSSLLIPGLRGRPDVITTTVEFAVAR